MQQVTFLSPGIVVPPGEHQLILILPWEMLLPPNSIITAHSSGTPSSARETMMNALPSLWMKQVTFILLERVTPPGVCRLTPMPVVWRMLLPQGSIVTVYANGIPSSARKTLIKALTLPWMKQVMFMSLGGLRTLGVCQLTLILVPLMLLLPKSHPPTSSAQPLHLTVSQLR